MKNLERIYGWLLVSPAVLPLVVWGGVIYPYLVPKTLAFYTITFAAVAAFLVLVAHGRSFYFRRLAQQVFWIPAALLALAYLASALGIDFYRSFWGMFVRGDGLLTLTCVITFFYLIALFADRVFARRLWHTVAVVGGVVALYGIGEWVFQGGRVGSLLGNAAFFAGYVSLALFATLLSAHECSGAWRRVAYATAALEVIAVILSATRGSMLALVAAGIVALIALACTGQGMARRRSAAALIALALIAVLFVAFRADFARVPFAPVARLASISAADADTSSRLFIWKHMLREVAERPLLGVGAEHIDVLFNTFYDPTKIQEQWFDRSHNAFLDYAAQFGVGGALLYALLIASFFLAAYRLYNRGAREGALIVALIPVTYAVQNFFVFDTISSLWLMLALLSVALATSREDQSSALAFNAPVRWLSYGAVLIALGALIPVVVRPAIAAYDVAHAYALGLVDSNRASAYLASGMAQNTYADLEYGYTAFDIYANHQAGVLTGDSLARAYESAHSILARNFERYPYDARTALYYAQVLSLAPAGTSTTDALSNAVARAVQESPGRYQSWYILVNIAVAHANTFPIGSAARLDGYTAAIDILRKYTAIVPELSEPHFVIAQLLYASGNPSGAAAEAALGKGYYTSDLPTAHRASAYYETIGDWKDAAFFLKDMRTLAPSDYTSRYDYAKVLFMLGDKAAAAREAEALRALDPSMLSSDQNFEAALSAYEASVR